jgi:hypothetical protein
LTDERRQREEAVEDWVIDKIVRLLPVSAATKAVRDHLRDRRQG